MLAGIVHIVIWTGISCPYYMVVTSELCGTIFKIYEFLSQISNCIGVSLSWVLPATDPGSHSETVSLTLWSGSIYDIRWNWQISAVLVFHTQRELKED